ncbi:hsp70 nucleotide exchange factor fes1 [Neonectria punicea]|uniref:Hsp70 nucleotide exchange factor fes1 n=1 Tax=Neonectria punicea TaxID=979145 RepID=A0ABR1HKP8_9HYPO
MDDKRLNELLKWSIENSDNTKSDPNVAPPTSDLTPELMATLMGGPSDADLMKASMEIITTNDPEQVTLDDKLIAFDNFEQLIEGLDNANNMANLGLWTPLLEQLRHDERDVRKMAAWCIGTAVQNNVRTQESLLTMGEHGLPQLVHLATHEDEHEDVRRKAVYALSSACRNYQPAMDVFAEELTKKGHATEKVDATNMEAVDEVVHGLRDKIKKA